VAKAKCEEFDVALFYKQGNGFKSGTNPQLDEKIIQEFPVPRVVSDTLAFAE
jgi:uncharacterized caspase-like protein